MNINERIVGVLRTRMGPRGLEYLIRNEGQSGKYIITEYWYTRNVISMKTMKYLLKFRFSFK